MYKATGLVKALNVVHCGRKSWFCFSALPPSAPTCVQTLLISLWKLPTVIPVLLSKPFMSSLHKVFEVLFTDPLGMTFWLSLSCVGICWVWKKKKACLHTYLSHFLVILVQGISEGNLNRGMLWPCVSFRRVFVPHYYPYKSTKDFY